MTSQKAYWRGKTIDECVNALLELDDLYWQGQIDEKEIDNTKQCLLEVIREKGILNTRERYEKFTQETLAFFRV